MPYTLRRGSQLLGRVETGDTDGKAIAGLLIPEPDVELRGEIQWHLPSNTGPKLAEEVVTMPAEAHIVDAPPPPSSGGSFALQPVGDDAIVKPADVLHLFLDTEELRVRNLWLTETRYLGAVPAGAQRGLPAGALRGRGYWTVAAFVDRPSGDTQDTDFAFDKPDALSP